MPFRMTGFVGFWIVSLMKFFTQMHMVCFYYRSHNIHYVMFKFHHPFLLLVYFSFFYLFTFSYFKWKGLFLVWESVSNLQWQFPKKYVSYNGKYQSELSSCHLSWQSLWAWGQVAFSVRMVFKRCQPICIALLVWHGSQTTCPLAMYDKMISNLQCCTLMLGFVYSCLFL